MRSRWRPVILLIVRVVLPGLVIMVAVVLKLRSPVTAVSFVTIFFIGFWITNVANLWFRLGVDAIRLADEAADILAANNDKKESSVQRVEITTRRLPPRQMYACAVARQGEPIIMYRGWRVFHSISIDRPEHTRTTGLTCRKYRP